MDYENFKQKVNALIRRVGGISVRFNYDIDNGKFYANCSDGTTIVGNPSCLKVMVRWGSGHQVMATI